MVADFDDVDLKREVVIDDGSRVCIERRKK
jgi:hypothetical protein